MIALAKQLFMLELEQGHQVSINNELQNQNYPMSCRFYDFIINYALNTFNETKKCKYNFESS